MNRNKIIILILVLTCILAGLVAFTRLFFVAPAQVDISGIQTPVYVTDEAGETILDPDTRKPYIYETDPVGNIVPTVHGGHSFGDLSSNAAAEGSEEVRIESQETPSVPINDPGEEESGIPDKETSSANTTTKADVIGGGTLKTDN